jgi:hypothetical protein
MHHPVNRLIPNSALSVCYVRPAACGLDQIVALARADIDAVPFASSSAKPEIWWTDWSRDRNASLVQKIEGIRALH